MSTSPNLDLKIQSVEYYEGQGPIHRSFKSPKKLIVQADKNIRTINDSIQASFSKREQLLCAGQRKKFEDGKWGPFEWLTYKEVKKVYESLASGLRAIGIEPKGHLAIYSKNRPEWLYTYIACATQAIVLVPLYDSLGPDASFYIINHASIETVISSLENLPKLIKISSKEKTQFKRVVVLDPFTENDAQEAKKVGLTLIPYNELLALGSKNPPPQVIISPEDLLMIMYTSGTTGVPKGVMLTHRNMVATLSSLHFCNLGIREGDVHLSYLPLAHIMELTVITLGIHEGCSVGFWRGDLQGLLEDFQTLRPTVMNGPPRIFNRIYDKIHAQLANNVFSRTLFNYAYNAKLTQLHTMSEELSPLWDKIVFSKIAALIGGRVRIIISGSAPLAPNVQDFLRICFLSKVVQGYGLTESCCLVSMAEPSDSTSGHVGPPVVSIEVKLVDVPEMNYTSSGKIQQGEICVRGPGIFKGYYKMPEKTAEDIDRDGWFHTGDIGEWLPNGTLKLIDRKKNIFKLAQGEYVAVEYLETVYIRCPYVSQIFVTGDSLQNYLVAIVIPDPEALIPAAAQLGIKEDFKDLCRNPQIKKLVYTSLIKVAEKAKLKGFEKIKNIYLDSEPWTPENGLLTPTLKAKRTELRKQYAKIIETLYAEPRLDGHVPKSKL